MTTHTDHNAMDDAMIEPVAGPRWTRKRLVAMLLDCYGPTRRGHVDVAAVADYAGVAGSTVRRWIAGGTQANRRTPAIPARRLAALQRGPQLTERRNRAQYHYALDAIAKIQHGQGVLSAWRNHGWLDNHTVAIVAIDAKPWQQVVVTNASPRAMNQLRRRAAILDHLVVPTRFHAQVLAHTVMTRQQHWRIHPSPQQLSQGRTQVWIAEAPPVNLSELANQAAANAESS